MSALFDGADDTTGRRPKRAEILARDIQVEIRERGWQVGTVLGGEGELLEKYQVSRGVLREAVRLLERSGVANMRRGPGGGLVVTRPNTDVVIASVATCLEFEGITRAQLFDARTSLELHCAELAAAHIDESGVERLREQLQEERRQAASGDFDAGQFHLVIAELADNPAIRLFVEVLTKLTVARSTIVGAPRTRGTNKAGTEMSMAHQAIAEAIIARDPALARHRMSRHLEAVSPWLRDQGHQAH